MEYIHSNFISDWKNEMLKKIEKENLKVPEYLDKDIIILRYLTYKRILGVRKPRKVYISKELRCPNKYKKGFHKLIKVIEDGGDISPYLSKRIVNLNFNDSMFNDWRIIHFHLGDHMEINSHYIERTGPLLFAYLKEDNVYLINIFKHGNWTKKEILQIVLNNWPKLIEKFVLKDMVGGLTIKISEKDHQELRNNNINAAVELDDGKGGTVVIIGPGMGMTCSGNSVDDLFDYQKYIRLLREREKNIKEYLIKELNVNTKSLSLRLVIEEGAPKIKMEKLFVVNDTL